MRLNRPLGLLLAAALPVYALPIPSVSQLDKRHIGELLSSAFGRKAATVMPEMGSPVSYAARAPSPIRTGSPLASRPRAPTSGENPKLFNNLKLPPMANHQWADFHALAQNRQTHPEAHLYVAGMHQGHAAQAALRQEQLATRIASFPEGHLVRQQLAGPLKQAKLDVQHHTSEATRHQAAAQRMEMDHAMGGMNHYATAVARPDHYNGVMLPYMSNQEHAAYTHMVNSGIQPNLIHHYLSRTGAKQAVGASQHGDGGMQEFQYRLAQEHKSQSGIRLAHDAFQRGT